MDSDSEQARQFRLLADRRNLITYLQYALKDVAAISLTSASLLGIAIAHLENDEDNSTFGLPVDRKELS